MKELFFANWLLYIFGDMMWSHLGRADKRSAFRFSKYFMLAAFMGALGSSVGASMGPPRGEQIGKGGTGKNNWSQ